MSNCIRPVGDPILGALDPGHFDYSRLQAAKDTDGSEIFWEDGQWILRMAELTTIREWRNFLWDHLQPFVATKNLRMDLLVQEESDGFKQSLTWTVKFLPPGTPRPTDSETWSKIF